ncbi:MAG: hypothetical protein ABIF01_01970 [Candidatus Micrarchaeota archaeon]
MRAQVSVDFIIASLIVMSIFSVAFFMYDAKTRGVGEVLSSLEAQRVGEAVAWEVNDVARGGEGTKGEVFLPDAIWGEPYYVTVDGRWVEVVWNHGGSENRLAVPLMTNGTKGGMFPSNSRVAMENKGGYVEIS